MRTSGVPILAYACTMAIMWAIMIGSATSSVSDSPAATTYRCAAFDACINLRFFQAARRTLLHISLCMFLMSPLKPHPIFRLRVLKDACEEEMRGIIREEFLFRKVESAPQVADGGVGM